VPGLFCKLCYRFVPSFILPRVAGEERGGGLNGLNGLNVLNTGSLISSPFDLHRVAAFSRLANNPGLLGNAVGSTLLATEYLLQQRL